MTAPPSDSCVLVTGASRGIGAAVAQRLSRTGLKVAVNYRQDKRGATEVVDEIRAEGGTAVAISGDVSKETDVQSVFRAAEHDLGPVLRVVNNAGTREDGLLAQISPSAWRAVVDTNLGGPYLVTRRAIGPMLRSRFGRIVNVASIVGPRANAGQANYAAAKAGLIGFTKTAAVEMARRGVTVNAVAPGLVQTALTSDLPSDMATRVPMGRCGTPDEIAACIEFLLSTDASYVTGAALVVDGGLSA